jgi:4-azaleucine resistance transporter AzlC
MQAPPRSLFTTAGLIEGVRFSLPVWPGLIVFGSAFGAAAVQKGLTLGQTLSMSAFVYAGAAQMVALELWQQVWTPATILTLVAVTAVVNARMILMGAAIQPWLAKEPKVRTAFNLFFLTDASWLIGSTYHAGGGRDVGVLLGSGLAIWGVWVLGTLPGYLAGSLVPQPERYGLDLVLPIFFATMLAPLWKGWGPARPWAVAGLVALVVHALVPGYAFIIAGALAGALAGAFLE